MIFKNAPAPGLPIIAHFCHSARETRTHGGKADGLTQYQIKSFVKHKSTLDVAVALPFISTTMKIPRNAIAKVTEAVFGLNCRKATVYLSERAVVRATALHRQRGNCRSATLVLTTGQPNYAEREYIKTLKRAGEPLPCRKVILKGWPKK